VEAIKMSETFICVGGGKIGDFLHQLGIAKAYSEQRGKKAIILIRNFGDGFAMGINKAYEDLKEIVLSQDYVADFRIYRGESVSVNLSLWRSSPLLYRTSFDMIFKHTYGINFGSEPWLKISSDGNYKDSVLFFHSTIRYNKDINFENFFKNIGVKVTFVTMFPKEYEEFCNRHRILIPVLYCESLQKFASVISNCKLLITNMTLSLVLALATKQKTVVILPHSIDWYHIVGLEEKYPLDWYFNKNFHTVNLLKEGWVNRLL
jgi:ADP-heptose:LPS heptosyltransferase